LDDFANTPDYRPVSRLAVAALALGVASLVVFVAPAAAVVVPMAGIAVGVLALRRIRREPSLAGGNVAVAGLGLAVLSLVAGPTYWQVREWQLRREAEALARRFAEHLLAGETREAHQMTLAAARRFPIDRPLADSYREEPLARGDLAKFADREAVSRLRMLGERPITRVEVEWHESVRGVDLFGVVVESAENDSEAAAFVLRLLVKRTAREGGGEWVVSKFFVEGSEDAEDDLADSDAC
jgi:hypothetical protein